MAPNARTFWKEILAGALLAALLLGFAVASTPLDALGAWLDRGERAFGHRHGGWHGDPARARKHAEFATEFVLREVDASDEQTERVKAIVLPLVEELQALGAQHRGQHERLLALLEQPEIDRVALQAMRAETLALADSVSIRLVDALVDAAAVLDIEQRARLVELAQEMHGRHR